LLAASLLFVWGDFLDLRRIRDDRLRHAGVPAYPDSGRWWSPSLDYFVGEGEQNGWDHQAERLGSRNVDDQIELRRLLYGDIGRLGTPQNLINKAAARR
jgi:hypothetical protein